jgi:hypothetical protein
LPARSFAIVVQSDGAFPPPKRFYQIQHVRSPPTVQLKHVYFLKMLRQTPHTEGFAIVAGIVQIDNEPAIHINQQHRILVSVGDRINADTFRQLNPFPIG